MNSPIITVATVCYNAVAYIEELVLSVINQTYQNVQFIVIDGESTDGTVQLLSKYRDHIDIFISEPDRGIYDAMNKAIAYSEGDYLIFMGADDHFLTFNTLEMVSKSLVDKKAIYYGSVLKQENNSIYWGEFNAFKWARGSICHQCLFYPKDVYKEFTYDLRFKINADYYYNLSLYRKFRFEYIDLTISYFASGGTSAHVDSEWAKIYDYIVFKELGFLPFLYKKARNITRRFLEIARKMKSILF